MSETFVISDLHLNHRNIIKYRPQFSTVEEHDATITQNVLETVSKKDSLWLLGDCFFDEPSIQLLRLLKDKGVIVNWVLGNHDTDNAKRQRLIRQILQEDLVFRVGSLFKRGGFWFSHHPVHPLELRNSFNVHGHVHAATLPDNRYYNVSCENLNYTPISYFYLKELFYGNGENNYIAPENITPANTTSNRPKFRCDWCGAPCKESGVQIPLDEIPCLEEYDETETKPTTCNNCKP